MKYAALFLAAIALTGCGADGEPEQPTATASLTVGASGVSGNAGVSVRQGPFTIFLGI